MLTFLTYNTLFGGRDGADDHRARLQIDLINARKPDVFFMQEAKGFEADGCALLHALEARIGMRGFLGLAPRTGQNVAIFIREPLRPLSFLTDNANFHHALAVLKVATKDDRTLTLLCAHLCPYGVEIRRREGVYLAPHASPDGFALLAGDFNASSPHDPEPEGFDVLSLRHRSRYVAEDPFRIDRSVLARLEAAGWTDIGHKLGGNTVHTVPAAGFPDTDFAILRCDYVMATPLLAQHAISYEVIRTAATDRASDHYPVLVTFDFDRGR